MEKQYWDKRDVSRLTGLSISTLSKWGQERKHLPYIKAGGRVLYDPKDVLAFMESHKVLPEEDRKD